MRSASRNRPRMTSQRLRGARKDSRVGDDSLTQLRKDCQPTPTPDVRSAPAHQSSKRRHVTATATSPSVIQRNHKPSLPSLPSSTTGCPERRQVGRATEDATPRHGGRVWRYHATADMCSVRQPGLHRDHSDPTNDIAKAMTARASQCTIPPHQLNHQHAEPPSHLRQNEGQPLWSSGSIETQKLAHHRFHKSKIAIWSVTQIKLIPRQLLPLHAPLTPAVFSVM